METRKPSADEKKRLSEGQEALKAVLDKYGLRLVPQITYYPDGSTQVQVGAMLIPQQGRIVVPELKRPT